MKNPSDLDWICVRAFAASDMNCAKAAESVYLSTSAIRYHLDKVKIKTGLNPFRFCELVTLLFGYDEALTNYIREDLEE